MSRQGFTSMLRVKGYNEFTSPEKNDGLPIELFHRHGDKSTVFSWVAFPDVAAGWRDADMIQAHPGPVSTALVTVMIWAPILTAKLSAELRSISISFIDRVPIREELRFEGRTVSQGAGKSGVVEGSVYDANDKLLVRGTAILDLHTPDELLRAGRCNPQDVHAFQAMLAKL